MRLRDGCFFLLQASFLLMKAVRAQETATTSTTTTTTTDTIPSTTATTTTTSTENFPGYEKSLNYAMSLWDSGIDGSGYEYTITTTTGEQQTVVVDSTGTVVSATDSSGNPVSTTTTTTTTTTTPTVQTVPELFSEIQRAIDLPATSIDVVYNGGLGYPETLTVDFDAVTPGNELSVSITDLCNLCDDTVA